LPASERGDIDAGASQRESERKAREPAADDFDEFEGEVMRGGGRPFDKRRI